LHALIQELIEGLRQARADPERLARLGAPEPERDAAALVLAATDPQLESSRERWLPPLLLTARPGHAARCLVDLAERHRATLGAPLDPDLYPALPSLLGSSDFLARLLLRHPHWVADLAGEPPPPPDAGPLEADWTAIRVAKYRALARIAARDLCGRSFELGLRELSDLADRCLVAALECAASDCGTPAPSLLALGKLGGRELNFSSDVDLLFLYEASDPETDLQRNSETARLIQTFKRHLESPSEDGFAYRVDLDLRPEGRRGALANSLDAALIYYETFGAEWERQMLIRLRPVAGPAGPARQFASEISPFVYRRAIDPQAIGRVRQMKTRIEDERRREGRDLEVDVKEGPGGIRDVEFLVQAFQLLHGGREPAFRGGNVLVALRALGRARVLPEPVAASLRDAYLWLRRAEHCLQLVEERQTQKLPRKPDAQIAHARRMGYTDAEGTRARDRYLEDWTAVRAGVRGQFEKLVLAEGQSDA
jgi:glutamate-ammonia-ligase adenylyltransferase